MRTVEVEVTQADIDAGIPCRTHSCPVALALSRALGVMVAAGYRTATVMLGTYREIRLPEHMVPWIVEYDRGGAVEPVAFVVEVADAA